jgi:hypothetical protein
MATQISTDGKPRSDQNCHAEDADQLNVMEDGLYEITEVGDYMLNQKNGSPYFIIIDRGLSMPRLCHH